MNEKRYLSAGCAVLLAVVLAGCSRTVAGSGSTTDTSGLKWLSHRAVEIYIEEKVGATGVLCNNGADVLLVANGEMFTCLGHRYGTSSTSPPETYHVKITNYHDGSYLVS